MKFTEFNFSAEIMDGLDAMGFETPSPVQELAIPKIIEDKDMIVCAQTGNWQYKSTSKWRALVILFP